MESKPKSDIIRKVLWAIEHKENASFEYLLKKTNLVVKIDVKISEQETFIDKDGVKWVRA